MNTLLSQNTAPWSATHPTTAEDKVAMAALRAMVEPLKGKLQGTAARPPFDAIMDRVPAPKGVNFEADTVGGILGLATARKAAGGVVPVGAYLGGADPTAPQASALYGDLAGLPPVRVHVGDDEVLLDDALRYVARAVEAGVDARVDIWQGMPHGFASGVGKLTAANQALAAIGAFLAQRLDAGAG